MLGGSWRHIVAKVTAGMVAVAAHALLSAALAFIGPPLVTTPPVIASFTVVELAASGAPSPPPPPEAKGEEQPEPEPLPEPEPEPEPEIDKPPLEPPPPRPMPKPREAAPKPKPRPEPETPTVERAPEAAERPRPLKEAAPGRQTFVAPSSRASYFNNPKPAYPAVARRRGMQGTVMLSVEVGIDGRPGKITILSSSGYPILDRTARDAVRKWRFIPASRGGQPVPARIEIPIRFWLSKR